MATVWRRSNVAGAVSFGASPLGAAFPVIATSFAIPVIYTCIRLAKEGGHIPQWLDTPPISLAGVHEPEATVYRVGFPLIMAALFLIERPVVTLLRAAIESGGAPEAEDGEGKDAVLAALGRASWTARIAFAGLGLQGVVPLQGWGTAASLVHVMSANVFFVLSIYHGACVLWCLSTRAADAAGASLPISRGRDTIAWALRGAVLVAAFFPMVPAMVLHPGTQPVDRASVLASAGAGGDVSVHGGSLSDAQRQALGQAEHERSMENAGFAQWWMVGSIVAYYALYARDLWLVGRANAGRLSEAQRARGVAGVVAAFGSSGGGAEATGGAKPAEDAKTR